jgi:hypothetical protein
LRKLFIGALVGALALAVAAIALADTTQTYKQKFSSNKVSKSAGTTFSTSSTDEANTANNKQPKSVRNFDIAFPAGTKIDSKGAPQCTKNDDEILAAGGKPACPKAVIGAGRALVRLPFNGTADINAKVTAFNANKGLVLYVDPSPIAQPLIIRPKFVGRVLKTPVAPNCLPPATVQANQCKKQDGSAGQEAVLVTFSLKTVAKKKGKHVLIKTPKTCKGTWKFSANLKYADGTSKKIDSLQPCKKH